MRAGHLRARRRIGKPDVLANDHRAANSVDVEYARRAARLEIAVLVEHRVVRQLLLAVDLCDAPVADHRNGVVSPALVRFRESDESRDAMHPRRKCSELGRARPQKRRPQQQVFGRIAAQRQLGSDDERRTRAPRRVDRVAKTPRIAGEIAENLVQLRDRNLHGRAPNTMKP